MFVFKFLIHGIFYHQTHLIGTTHTTNLCTLMCRSRICWESFYPLTWYAFDAWTHPIKTILKHFKLYRALFDSKPSVVCRQCRMLLVLVNRIPFQFPYLFVLLYFVLPSHFKLMDPFRISISIQPTA